MDADEYVPEGQTIVFPDLASLTPATTGDRYARVGARLVAFYEAVRQQLGRSEMPYVGGVWVSPVDYDRLCVGRMADPSRRPRDTSPQHGLFLDRLGTVRLPARAGRPDHRHSGGLPRGHCDVTGATCELARFVAFFLGFMELSTCGQHSAPRFTSRACELRPPDPGA